MLACLWGVDYINDPPKGSLYVVEKMVGPLPIWGGLFLFFGLMGLIGELWMEIGGKNSQLQDDTMLCIIRPEYRWWPSYTAHAALCAMYTSLGWGCLVELVANGHLYGMRVVGGMFAIAVGHWVFAQRRRHAP